MGQWKVSALPVLEGEGRVIGVVLMASGSERRPVPPPAPL